MTRPDPKRPLLPVDERNRLRRMAIKAKKRGEFGTNRSYCKGVSDVLDWLNGEQMSPMLREMML